MQASRFAITIAIIAIVSCKGRAALLASCNDVLAQYQRIGTPVTDCQDNPTGNSTFWRIDSKQTYLLARASCKSGGDNADIAVVKDFNDQRILNNLFTSKTTLGTWMWIGIARNVTNGELTWVDDSPVEKHRWYPYPDSTENGDCAIMLVLADQNGDADTSGTFYYTEDCSDQYIVACQATDVVYT